MAPIGRPLGKLVPPVLRSSMRPTLRGPEHPRPRGDKSMTPVLVASQVRKGVHLPGRAPSYFFERVRDVLLDLRVLDLRVRDVLPDLRPVLPLAEVRPRDLAPLLRVPRAGFARRDGLFSEPSVSPD